MFILSTKLDNLLQGTLVIDSLLETGPSGQTKSCNFTYFLCMSGQQAPHRPVLISLARLLFNNYYYMKADVVGWTEFCSTKLYLLNFFADSVP